MSARAHPRRQKQCLELLRRRAFDAHVGVTPTFVQSGIRARARSRSQRIGGADVDASGEAYPSIHDYDLAMVPIVHSQEQHRVLGIERPKGEYLDTALAKVCEKALRGGNAANRVVQHPDLHAFGPLFLELQRDLLTDGIVGEDVGFEVYVMLRLRDCGADGVKRLRTVDQRMNGISRQKRCSHCLAHRIEQVVHVRILRSCVGGLRQCCVACLFGQGTFWCDNDSIGR